MPNRLAGSTSPYLLQHKDNPVDWWPWGDEAFAEAQRRDVPVLVSIGYAACHWCHVMAHESFEDPAVAQLVNDSVVAVKVDREERPDVDAVYMEATQALTGQGGWPMTVFTTPTGEPFFCGTYFPPSPRHGMPSFPQLVTSVAQTWGERREDVLAAGQRIVTALAERSAVPPAGAAPPGPADLDAAVRNLAATFDRANGGFGDAPKFPPSMVLEQLLRHHARTGDAEALRLVEATCDAMARGGMYDQIGGGFARYSVDARWVVPHFEKMLYDNALLVRVYAHLWRATGSELGPPGGSRHRGLDGARAAHHRGRLRLGPRRGHRRRRGAHLRLDTGAARRGARQRRRSMGRGPADRDSGRDLRRRRVDPAAAHRPRRLDALGVGAGTAARGAGRAPPAGARRQGRHGLERPGCRGPCRGRRAAGPT